MCTDHWVEELFQFCNQKTTKTCCVYLHDSKFPTVNHPILGMRIFGIFIPPANDGGKFGPPNVTLLLLRGVPAGEAPFSALRWLPAQ